MHPNPKKTSLLILGLTSILLSRGMLLLFNDPEGPNLLIVIGLAAIVYAISLAVYLSYPFKKQDGPKKLLFLILIQIVIVAGIYFCLK